MSGWTVLRGIGQNRNRDKRERGTEKCDKIDQPHNDGSKKKKFDERVTKWRERERVRERHRETQREKDGEKQRKEGRIGGEESLDSARAGGCPFRGKKVA